MNHALSFGTLGLLALAVAVPSTAGFAIALGVAALLGGSRVWLGLVRRGVEVDVSLPARMVQGEETPMTVTVTNRSRLPAPRIRVEVTLPTGRLLPGESILEVALPPRASVRHEIDVTAYVRGRWQPPPVNLEVGDPWGVWLLPATAPGAAPVTVLPAIVPVRHVDLPAVSHLAELPDLRSLTTDPTAIVGVRPYQPGDPLRSIHWPATAATGTLVRRENERAWARELVVLLDLDARRWDRYDQQPVEVAISVAASLLTHATLTLRQPAALVVSLPGGSAPAADDPALPSERTAWPAARFGVGASRSHLDAMLVHLAGVVRHRGAAIEELLQREAAIRPPGTTLAVITTQQDARLREALSMARRAGLAPLLLEVGTPDALHSSGPTWAPRFPVSTADPIGSTRL